MPANPPTLHKITLFTTTYDPNSDAYKKLYAFLKASHLLFLVTEHTETPSEKPWDESHPWNEKAFWTKENLEAATATPTPV